MPELNIFIAMIKAMVPWNYRQMQTIELFNIVYSLPNQSCFKLNKRIDFESAGPSCDNRLKRKHVFKTINTKNCNRQALQNI